MSADADVRPVVEQYDDYYPDGVSGWRRLGALDKAASHVFVKVPTEDTTRRRKDYEPDRVGHINFHKPRTIRWLVQSVGLRVLKQATTNPSKAVCTFQTGRKALIHYHTKDLLLRLAPTLATRHFCYREALLATTQPMDGTEAEPAGRVGSEPT